MIRRFVMCPSMALLMTFILMIVFDLCQTSCVSFEGNELYFQQKYTSSFMLVSTTAALARRKEGKGWKGIGFMTGDISTMDSTSANNSTLIDLYFVRYSGGDVFRSQLSLGQFLAMTSGQNLTENTDTQRLPARKTGSKVFVRREREFRRDLIYVFYKLNFDASFVNTTVVYLQNDNQSKYTMVMGQMMFDSPQITHSLYIDSETRQLFNETVCYNSTASAFAYRYTSYWRGVSAQNMVMRILMCVLIIGYLLVLVLFRKKILIASRFLTPFICLTLLLCLGLFSLLANFVQTIVIRKNSKKSIAIVYPVFQSWEIVVNLARTAAFSANGIIFAVHIVRFFAIINLYTVLRKQQWVLGEKSNRLLFVYRIVFSKVAMFIFITVLVLVSLSVLIITLMVVDHPLERENDAQLSSLILSLISAFFSFSAFTIDFFIHLSNIRKKGIRSYFQFSDPLMYRFEMLFGLVLTVPITISWIIARLLHKRKFFRAFPLLLPNTYVIMINCAGLVLLIELKRWIVQRYKKWKGVDYVEMGSHLSDVEKILLNDQSFELLERYASSEFSGENLLLWQVLYPFKLEGSIPSRDAHQMYHMFLKDGAELEANVSYAVRTELSTEIDKAGPDESVEFSENFDRLYRELLVNLSDTVARFIVTTEYKNHMNAKQVEDDLLASEFRMTDDIRRSYRIKPRSDSSYRNLSNSPPQ